jgi:hypothetical protein
VGNPLNKPSLFPETPAQAPSSKEKGKDDAEHGDFTAAADRYLEGNHPERRNIYFVQDGGPMNEWCGLHDCLERSVGQFLMIDDETDKQLSVIDLCLEHARMFATGFGGQ